MDYDAFAADLTRHPTLRFEAAEQAVEAFHRAGVPSSDLRQLDKGKYRSDLVALAHPEALLLSHRFANAVHCRVGPAAGQVRIITSTTSGKPFISSGVDCRDKLVFLPPEGEADFIAPALTGSEALSLPAARFHQLLRTISPTAARPSDSLTAVIEGDADRLRALRQRLTYLATHPEQASGQEQVANLLARIVAWMAPPDARWDDEGHRLNGARIRIAHRVRDYLEDHYRSSVRLEALCREVGVGLRTAQRAFTECFQISPYQYLKYLRLNKARRDLASGRQGTHQVTDIALDNGFTHLGRFAVVYRETFGESPRETLRRA